MDTDTVAYVGMWTGVIGALTGIAGAIMGYVAYQHSKGVRESDRRLELDKLRNAAQVAAESLLDVLPKALQSRRAVLSASGMFHSSVMEHYQTQYGQDLIRATELAEMVPSAETTFNFLSASQLEKAIVDLDRAKGQIDDLLDAYQASLAKDDTMRKEIRANAQTKGR